MPQGSPPAPSRTLDRGRCQLAELEQAALILRLNERQAMVAHLRERRRCRSYRRRRAGTAGGLETSTRSLAAVLRAARGEHDSRVFRSGPEGSAS